MVEGLILYGMPVLAAVLYVNTVSLFKKIKRGEDTTNNTAWGAILLAIIVFGFLLLIGISEWK